LERSEAGGSKVDSTSSNSPTGIDPHCIEQNDYIGLAQGCFGLARGGWVTDLARAPIAAYTSAPVVKKFQLGQG
jgi:hypothetical protein